MTSPEPLPKKEASPAVLWGERVLEMLWKPQMPLIIGFGGSQPYSRREFQETLWERFRGLSGIYPELLPESPSRTGVWPIDTLRQKAHVTIWPWRHLPQQSMQNNPEDPFHAGDFHSHSFWVPHVEPRYLRKVSRYVSHFYRGTFAKVCPHLGRK